MMRASNRTTALPIAPDAPSVAVRSVPHLFWTDGGEPRRATVDRRSVLGSAPHCDLIIADPTVSRVHAEIEPRNEGIWIRDLNSRNGTFVEGVRVESASVLHGFTIRVGATDIAVDYGNAEHKPIESWPSESFGPLVGRSPIMRELFASLARLAPLDCSIMIQGETGTGKELVARAIHQASGRASGPFVVVDCGALSESLIETELFGHVKGSFTGAHQTRVGAIEAADGGTVFLDEIGELPMAMQPKLLRALESSTVRRIGESKHRNVNVRFVTATHRDLLLMVNRGEFREDLYFRLAVVPVRVPAVRERTEDVELLLHHFSDGSSDWLTTGLLRTLQSNPWRGNVREIRNFVARARAMGAADALSASRGWEDFREPVTAITAKPILISADPGKVLAKGATRAPAPRNALQTTPDALSFAQSFRAFRDAWMNHGERAFLCSQLERHDGNVAGAAKEAGIDRTHMYRLIRKHGL